MTIEELQKQNERIEGFKEGYQSCLQWMAMKMQTEKQTADAELVKINADTAEKN